LVLEKALPGASGSLALERMQKDRPVEANWGIFGYSREAKWKSRSTCIFLRGYLGSLIMGVRENLPFTRRRPFINDRRSKKL
jgi:hypothetical protein